MAVDRDGNQGQGSEEGKGSVKAWADATGKGCEEPLRLRALSER